MELITGEIKSKVDRIWDAFWTGGVSNPLEVMEQITYLLFIKRLEPANAGGKQSQPHEQTDGAANVSRRQRPQETFL
jgi:type I restriction enzyme M protein